jgi:hypothetical protein
MIFSFASNTCCVDWESMSSIPSQPSAEPIASPWRTGLRKVVNSRWTFVGLQALDLVTTLVAFRMGAFEVNPMVAHLTVEFGRVRGVVISKLIAVVIAMGVRRLLWIVNLLYAAIIFWNTFVLLALPAKLK